MKKRKVYKNVDVRNKPIDNLRILLKDTANENGISILSTDIIPELTNIPNKRISQTFGRLKKSGFIKTYDDINNLTLFQITSINDVDYLSIDEVSSQTIPALLSKDNLIATDDVPILNVRHLKLFNQFIDSLDLENNSIVIRKKDLFKWLGASIPNLRIFRQYLTLNRNSDIMIYNYSHTSFVFAKQKNIEEIEYLNKKYDITTAKLKIIY